MKLPKQPLFFPIIGGVAWLLLGVGLILWPDNVIGVFPPLIGVVMIVVGALGIAQCIVMSRRLMEPGLKLVQSVVTIVVGLIFVLKQDLSLAFLTILFGIYVLVSAAIEFSQAMESRREKKPWAGSLVESLFEFALGFILLLGPFSERNFWVRLLGVYFVIAAAVLLRWLLQLRRTPVPKKAETDDDAPPGGE